MPGRFWHPQHFRERDIRGALRPTGGLARRGSAQNPGATSCRASPALAEHSRDLLGLPTLRQPRSVLCNREIRHYLQARNREVSAGNRQPNARSHWQLRRPGDSSPTPINQTASKPSLARASHSSKGTLPKSTDTPVLRLSSESQTHVLISYSVDIEASWEWLHLFRFDHPCFA